MAIFPRLCLERTEGTRPYRWNCSDCSQSTPMCGRSSTNVPIGFTLSVVCFFLWWASAPCFFVSLQFLSRCCCWNIGTSNEGLNTFQHEEWFYDEIRCFQIVLAKTKVVGSCWTKALKTWCSKSPVGHIQAPTFLRVKYYSSSRH